jgi:NADPH:quinone reductase-like Zn-dependent oxidoreductase
LVKNSRTDLDFLASLVATKVIDPFIAKSFKLEQTAADFTILESLHITHKVVINL